jgi:hypothetical protein
MQRDFFSLLLFYYFSFWSPWCLQYIVQDLVRGWVMLLCVQAPTGVSLTRLACLLPASRSWWKRGVAVFSHDHVVSSDGVSVPARAHRCWADISI